MLCPPFLGPSTGVVTNRFLACIFGVDVAVANTEYDPPIVPFGPSDETFAEENR